LTAARRVSRAWKRPWRVFLGIAVAAVLVASCSPAVEAPEPTRTPTRNVFVTPTPVFSDAEMSSLLGADFIRPESGFFISYPKAWEYSTDPEQGFDAAFRAPVGDHDAGGEVFASIAVGSDPAPNYTGRPGREYLDNTLTKGVQVLEASMKDFELIASYVQKLPSGDAAVFEYRYTSAEAHRVRSIQLVIPGPTRLFLLTATALDSAWKTYERTFVASAASFTILAGR